MFVKWSAMQCKSFAKLLKSGDAQNQSHALKRRGKTHLPDRPAPAPAQHCTNYSLYTSIGKRNFRSCDLPGRQSAGQNRTGSVGGLYQLRLATPVTSLSRTTARHPSEPCAKSSPHLQPGVPRRFVSKPGTNGGEMKRLREPPHL